jgi:hypothetical protein
MLRYPWRALGILRHCVKAAETLFTTGARHHADKILTNRQVCAVEGGNSAHAALFLYKEPRVPRRIDSDAKRIGRITF